MAEHALPNGITLRVHDEDLTCPCCGATELTPESYGRPVAEWRFQIRAFKVDDWSHCTRCDNWFNLKGELELPAKPWPR